MQNSCCEFVENVLKTESRDFEGMRKRLESDKTLRLLHAAMGMVTEAGELLDILKRHIYYGAPLDEVHIGEEIGDSFFYCGIAADAIGMTFEELMHLNNLKLKKRYGNKFTSERALNRDLDAERKVLEGGDDA